VHTCTEYCGTAHAEMATSVRVVDQAEYDAWFEEIKEEANAESSSTKTQG